MDADIELVLAAVDSSDEAVEAAEYAIAIAERDDADLHLLHILDQRVMRGVETGDVSAETVTESGSRSRTRPVTARCCSATVSADTSPVSTPRMTRWSRMCRRCRSAS